MKLRFLLTSITLVFLCTALSTSLMATTYYVSSQGNDANSGQSPTKAWASLTKVNATAFKPGDCLLFEGGKTFRGTLTLDANDSGTPTKPLLIGSYGRGRATLTAGQETALLATNCAGVIVKNLNVVGTGGDNENDGILFTVDLASGAKLKLLYIDSVDVHGFSGNGILLSSEGPAYAGYEGVAITHVKTYENGKAGIATTDAAGTTDTNYGFRYLYIAHCEANQNTGAGGIVLGGVENGLVEYCHASGNCRGYSGGVGIWGYSMKNVVFQYCIADHTETTYGDGEGFDLDGGSDNCVIQYCYSYDNFGPGYMHCDYPGSRPTRNNIMQYCISQNDARFDTYNASGFVFLSYSTGIEDCKVVNNVVYQTPRPGYKTTGLRALRIYGEGSTNVHLARCVFQNNIVYLNGANMAFAVVGDLYGTGQETPMGLESVTYLNNDYYATNPASAQWVQYDFNKPYRSLAAWRDGTGQEKLNGKPVGYTLNPALKNPGSGKALTDPTQLADLLAGYQLKPGSPMIDAGLPVVGPLVARRDFFGNRVPQGRAVDLGIHEAGSAGGRLSAGETEKDLGVQVQPNPTDGDITITYVLPTESTVTLALVTMSGTESVQVPPQVQAAGEHTATLRTDTLSGGLYMLRVDAGGQRVTKKVIILR